MKELKFKCTYECIGYKNGKRAVVYYTLTPYVGIANDLHDKFRKMGYKRVTIHHVV